MSDIVDRTNNMAAYSVQSGDGEFIPVHEQGTQRPRRERGTQLLEALDSLVDGRPLARIHLCHVFDQRLHESQTEALLRRVLSPPAHTKLRKLPLTFMNRVLNMFPRWYTSMGNGL